MAKYTYVPFKTCNLDNSQLENGKYLPLEKRFTSFQCALLFVSASVCLHHVTIPCDIVTH